MAKSEDIEVLLLLEAIYQKYGYDFRSFTNSSIKNHILQRVTKSGFKNISEMQHEILYNKDFFEKFLPDLLLNKGEMFNDPYFYLQLRKKIFPILKSYPYLKIWYPECASGEEVYSIAILLNEEGLLQRTKFYATDSNPDQLKIARQGIIPANKIEKYGANYRESGGTRSFEIYYERKNGLIRLKDQLKKNIIFTHHSLTRGGVLGEMNLIICLKILKYLNTSSQMRTIKLFNDSLLHHGFLCLGKEDEPIILKYTNNFEKVIGSDNFYIKEALI